MVVASKGGVRARALAGSGGDTEATSRRRTTHHTTQMPMRNPQPDKSDDKRHEPTRSRIRHSGLVSCKGHVHHGSIKHKLLTQSKIYTIDTSSTSATANVWDVWLAPELALALGDGTRVRESRARCFRASLRYLS